MIIICNTIYYNIFHKLIHINDTGTYDTYYSSKYRDDDLSKITVYF